MEGITLEFVKTISLKLTEHLLARLEAAAKARRTTKSQLLRDSLETALESGMEKKGKSCYDLAADLVGSVKGLPKDIAHNPKYMKDFGL